MGHTQENIPGTFSSFETKQTIRKKFVKVTSINQLSTLLNFIEKTFKPEANLKKLTASDLLYLAKSKDSRYTKFTVSKKNGEKRTINAPDEYLKRVQQLLNILLQIIFEDKAHYNANGFLMSRDIVRNAKPHINKKYVLNLDIENYFPTINFRRIKVVLGLSPFNLHDDKDMLAFIVSNICTQKGYLPQGAPTSPIISNIVSQKLDRRITRLCNPLKIKYSRYADDLSFSTNKDVLNERFIEKITKIVETEGFKINTAKTRIHNNRQRQQVTGIIVNQKLNVNRNYLQKVRAILNNWEKGGESYAQSVFNSHYHIEKKGLPDFKNVLLGYINFIGLVRGKNDDIFIKLSTKFHNLKNRINYDFIDHESVRKRLEKDNKKMEMILLDKIHTTDDKFVAFCTAAFHQIENLINYFYWKRFPITNDLLVYLFNNNPSFNKRWKSIDKLPNYDRISKLNINVLVYIFEKEFYFDKGISYKQEITMLREIRNDESHRCEVIEFDSSQIIESYKQLKEKWKRYKDKHGTLPTKPENEKKAEFNYRLIKFLEHRNFLSVRETVRKVADQIHTFLNETQK